MNYVFFLYSGVETVIFCGGFLSKKRVVLQLFAHNLCPILINLA